MNQRLQRQFSSLLKALSLVLALLLPVQAAFQDPGFGARPVGMGGAFTAVADDANAPLFNPAGLTQVQWHEFSANYARLFSGLTLYSGDDTVHLDESYLAYVSKNSAKIGAFGLSWANFNTTHLYHEDTVALSYARNAGDLFPVLENDLSFGMNFKYLRRGITLDAVTANDPVFSSGDSASAFTVDAGVLYKPEEGTLAGWRLGFVAKNLTQPDVGFQETDRVPIEWRLGLAYQSRLRPWLLPALDFTRRDGRTDIHGGLESWLFHDALGLRVGGNNDEASAGASYYHTFGNRFGFRLDYGFTVPFYVDGTNGSHRVAATVYF